MIKSWRKTRADSRRWAAAQSLPDLANLMALWCEGELSMWPGHPAPADPETSPLTHTLAAANRAGFLTDQSQPGSDSLGYDGLRWQQRAAVSGWIADEQLLTQIRHAGEAAGLLVLISHPRLIPHGQGAICTIRDGRPYTRFGGHLPAHALLHLWPSISRQALDQVVDAWQVCLIDPDIGRNDRLWPLLNDLFATDPTTA